MVLKRANSDKPHRCPQCHRIPAQAWNDGQALWSRIYRCDWCQLRFWKGWSDDLVYTWIKSPYNKVKKQVRRG